jgi:predicted metal-dependent peptidase
VTLKVVFGDLELTDDHGEWDKSDLTEEQQDKFVKSHVKAIYESCSDKQRDCLDKTIIDELYKSEVDWRAQLRSFFANSEETFTETSRKKRNRRYGIFQPGNKNEPKINLGICVDTSGSISDNQLKLFFSEVARIFNEDTMVLHVIEADCVVRQVYTYKKNMKIKASGRLRNSIPTSIR